MRYRSGGPGVSALSRTASAFVHALSALGIFMLIPLMEQHVRPGIYSYFNETFSSTVSLWSSWGFVVILAICVFFGSSAVLYAIVHLMKGKPANKSES